MELYQLRRGNFKNLTLRIVSADGSLVVSAPWFVPRFWIDRFVAEKAEWIASKRATLPPPEDRSTLNRVWVWGTVHRVRVVSPGRFPRVLLQPDLREVVLRVPPGWTPAQHRRVVEAWEKQRVTEALETLVPHWTARMGLVVDRWMVKRMRSRWGSCRPDTRSLVFNTRLGALPPECLEHVVVHELVHLLEPRHNARFHALVHQWLPPTEAVRTLLRSGIGSADLGASPEPPSRTEEEREP